MKYLNRTQIEEILNSNHGGESLSRLWDGILEHFPNISYEDCKAEFLSLIEFVVNEKILNLCGVWTTKENIWEGTTEGIVLLLKNWFPSEQEWNYQTDASFRMFYFDYPFIKWLKGYPIKLA
jgi:hypothetical protein